MDLSQTIHLLGDLLGQVISELESPVLFETEERIRALAKARRSGEAYAAKDLQKEVSSLQIEAARVIASAFATYFDLVNLAEENERVEILRKREDENYPRPINESIREVFAILRARGVTNEQMSTLLDNLSIELVLTAHPTESRRRTVLSKMERIALLLKLLKQNVLPRRQRDAAVNSIHAEIAELWLTDRDRGDGLTVTDEVRTGLLARGRIIEVRNVDVERLDVRIHRLGAILEADHVFNHGRNFHAGHSRDRASLAHAARQHTGLITYFIFLEHQAGDVFQPAISVAISDRFGAN